MPTLILHVHEKDCFQESELLVVVITLSGSTAGEAEDKNQLSYIWEITNSVL
jgi:hypothetical protein